MRNLNYLVLHPLFCFIFLLLLLAGLLLVTDDDIYLLLGELAVLFIVVIGLHESGHWLLGNIVGMRLHFLVFSFIMISKTGGKIRVGFNNSLPISFGVTKMSFDDSLSVHRLRQKKILYFAGGPLMNLFLLIIAFLLYGSVNEENVIVKDLFVYFMILNLMLAIATGIPFGGSDGENIIRLLKQKDKQVREESQIDSYYFRPVQQLTMSDIAWLKARLDQSTEYEEVYGITILLLHYYLAVNSLEEGKQILEKGLDIIPVEKEQMVLKQILTFYQVILVFSSNDCLSNEDNKKLKTITFWFGESLYTIAKAILKYQDNQDGNQIEEQKKQLRLELKKGLSKTDELFDPNQQEILKVILTPIIKVR